MTLEERTARVRMLIMDVDGVMTDAGMYYGEHGEELKKFNTRDGQGISLIHRAGIKTAIITGERTEIVSRRAAKLGIKEVHQGAIDKWSVAASMLGRLAITPDEVCYIGDDLGDLPILKRVGMAVVVADSTPLVRDCAHYITRAKGGEGAVREVCDLILSAQGKLGGLSEVAP